MSTPEPNTADAGSAPEPRRVPLAILDLTPIPEGATAAQALRNSVDLAQQAERAGYSRYWLAEHHLNPGVAGSAPHTLLGVLAASTETIRLGTAATILGNYEPLQVAEAFGTLAALYPGRADLGLGRLPILAKTQIDQLTAQAAAQQAGAGEQGAGEREEPPQNRLVDGLLIPPRRQIRIDLERFALQGALLGRREGDTDDFETQTDAILAFIAGGYVATTPSGAQLPITVQPAEGSDVQVWVHGSTAGPSARLAGKRGLRYGANYHVAPHGVLDSVGEYRAHFQPSAELSQPYVTVSVDVVVAATDEAAQRLAAGYADWVLSIRQGEGAIYYPNPENARPLAALSARELDSVQDRLDTRFVGSPATVVAKLETLQRVTGADELLVTTITHDHAARVDSYRLLAEAWLSA